MGELLQRDLTTEVVDSFENTFEKGNLIDTFSQVGEYALDQASKIEAVKDIPILGLLISGYKTIINVKEYHLTQKVFKFLYHLQDTTPEQRQKFSRKYCEANQEKTSLAILNILDQLNNANVIPIICNLMKAVIDEEITIFQFNRLIMAILRTSFTDLIQLRKFQEDYDEDGLTDSLLSAGLIYQTIYDGGHADNEESENKFIVNSNGTLLLRYGLKQSNVEDKPRRTEINAGPLWGEV